MINSYYSSYSLEYYEVGSVYSFYIRKGGRPVEAAEDDMIDKYAKKLDDLEEDHDEYPLTGKFSNLIRIGGVVVEKIKGNGNDKIDKIRFMIKVVDENGSVKYGTKLYAVNYRGIETDGWEAMPVQIELKGDKKYKGTETKIGGTASAGGAGRVTIDNNKNIIGRVTSADGDTKETKKATSGTKTVKKSTTGVTTDDKTGRVTVD